MVTNHIISGTANLMSGLVYLMKQFSGAWLGIGTASFLFPITVSSVPNILNIYEKWNFLCVLFLGLVIAYQTLKKDFIWVLGGCVLTYIGVMLGSEVYSTFSGTLLGAVVAGLLANIWASKTMRPTSIMLVPSITVLVSGSIGFRGLLNAAAGQTGQGVEQFLQMFVVALTIAAGLLVANTIIRPKITL
jgi:uncharacterized membrane protein YjjB (DUF3815 family)